MDRKIYVAGKICSGKSTLARKIADHTGYPPTSFGGILRDHLTKSDLPVTRENLQRVGQELIDQLGYEGFLRWSIQHSPQIYWEKPLIIDGLRHREIYSHLQVIFPQGILIYCACDATTQIERLTSRDQITVEEAQQILTHETEQHVSELESEAHLVFQPDDQFEDFLNKIDSLIQQP